MIAVPVFAVTVPATPPKVTLLALRRLAPLIVTLVPPDANPRAGVTEVIVGGVT